MSQQQLRVLGVIPGLDEATSMCFSRREMAAISESGVKVQCFFLRSRTSPPLILKEIWRLRREIKNFAPDVVHAQFGTMTALVCALVSHVPIVITFQGQDLNPSPADPWLRSILGRTLSHLAAWRAAQIICVSSRLRARIAYVKDRVQVIPSGVNTNLFHPMPREDCRRQIGWGADEKVVAFNGGSDPIRKRIDLAKLAFAYAKNRIPKLRLHIFDGNTPPDRMPLYLCAADCLIVASDYEGSPNVVKEAMACNLPVVSVDVGDVSELLDGVSCSVVVERDSAALGQSLVDVLLQGKRSNGCEKMRTLNANAIARRIIEVYKLASNVHRDRARRRSEMKRSGADVPIVIADRMEVPGH